MKSEKRDPVYAGPVPLSQSDRRNDRRIHARSRSGQTVLELVLVTPILLIMLFGAVDLGRYAYIAILVGNAARAGAAYGAEGLPESVDNTGITTAADNDFKNNGQSVSALDVAPISTSCGCDSAGTITAAGCSAADGNSNAGTCASGHWVVMVSVTASGTFHPLFPWPGIPQSVAVSSIAEMRVAAD